MSGYKGIVISLYDFTGEAVRPWAQNGYRCLCFDIQHDGGRSTHGSGVIEYIHWDADVRNWLAPIRRAVGNDRGVTFVFAFPPCDDLATSGAKHFARKLAADPDCQNRAMRRARKGEAVGNYYRAPWMVENPRSRLSTLWRKPDHKFDPCDYGGYLRVHGQPAAHPTWPEYIPPNDAYTKGTWLWVGNGFVMPSERRVEPVIIEFENGKRGSPQWARLGGKSLKTKNIRSATPRGFAWAVWASN